MKGGNWTKHNKARRDFGQQHDEDSTKSLWGPKHPHWVVKKWSGGQIVTKSKIDQGSCTPILTIRLMKNEQLLGAYFKKHGDKNYEYIGKEFEGLSKHCACNTDEQKRTCQTVEQQKQVDLEEVNTEFPTFNKLIQELVMIQKLLSKKP